MTYLSSSVSAGDATKASQYNNLRADALRFGAEESSSSDLYTLLFRYMSDFDLSAAGAVITLSAAPTRPAAVVIDGIIKAVTADLTLDLTNQGLQNNALFYLFAVLNTGDGGFTISAKNNESELSGTRLIGYGYWDGSGVTSGSLKKILFRNVYNEVQDSSVCQGRLTLSSGAPVSGNVDSSGTVYFSPYNGNRISLYDGLNRWVTLIFSEISLDISLYAAGGVYDIFAYLSGGGAALTSKKWTNSSTRATGITRLGGVLVDSENNRLRYLGTIGITDTAGICADNFTQRLVWNANHQVRRSIKKAESITFMDDNNPGCWVPYLYDVNMKIKAVIGLDYGELEINGLGKIYLATTTDSRLDSYADGVGIGIDSSTTDFLNNSNVSDLSAFSLYDSLHYPKLTINQGRSLGMHAYYLLMYSKLGNTRFQGDYNNDAGETVGLSGYILG